MQDFDLRGMRVAIIASDGFEMAELTEPLQALRGAQAQVSILAPQEGSIQGFRHFDKADAVRVDQRLSAVTPDDFDAVMLPGGTFNADFIRMDEDLQNFLQEFQSAGKPIAAICHAAWELVSAELVRGRTLTSYHTIQDDIRNAGGIWVDHPVVEDANWVTSRQPDDLPAFNEAMLKLFALHHHKSEERPNRSLDSDTSAAI